MIVLFVERQTTFLALLKPLPCDDLHVPVDGVFVLLAGRRGRDQVGDALGQVAVIFRAVLRDGVLDVFSLLSCSVSALLDVQPVTVSIRLSKPVKQIFRP